MLNNIFKSLGLKRIISSWLSTIVEVLRAVPGAAEYVSTIEVVAGFFGITGIGHAGVSGGLSEKKLATASAAVASLLMLSHFVPALAPFAPFLQKIAALLGTAAIATSK